ncbi:S-layer family protein [Limnohabitans sp. WS1]|uniref:beta strand repeat-containing protein n=1 Tax=Limnohabitans sp. WS1 TaxID=1100726 RepID=UPI001E4F422A|nr:VCBS domain-containing protein [Limnohabitans sp. WS1]
MLNAAELASGKISVKVKLSADAKAGDTLVIEGTGNTAQTITLSAAQVAAKEVVTDFANVPANGTKFVATAQLSDLAKNISNKVEDFAVINTDLPGAPKVVILEDANDNSFISRAELSGAIDVKVTVPAGAVVGDTITVTDGVSAPQNFTLTQTQIDNGILTSFAAPADGATFSVSATLKATGGSAPTNAVSNPGTDSAKLDLTDFSKVDPANPNGPRISAVGVNIDTDANGLGDGIITSAELLATGSKIKVTILLPQGAAAGDTLTVNASGNSLRQITLTPADIAAQKVVITDYNSVGEGNTFEVSASIKDQAGNASPTPDAKDSAILRTVIAGAPVVVITEDANNDGFINVAELSGTVGISISIPTAAQVGDVLKVTINGTPENITLTAADLLAASITRQVSASNGQTVTAKAQLIAAGNQASAEGSDTAVIDTTAPNGGKAVDLSIDTDTNNDGWINRKELGADTSVKVTAKFDPALVDVGDKVTFTAADGSAPQIVTLDAASKAAGQVSVSFAAPAEGASINVKAVLKDSSGNATPEATDSAKRDTSNFGPVDPTVDPANADKNISIEITSDLEAGGGNAVLSVAELAAGKISVKVKLSADAKAGDTLVIEGTGNEAQTITLSAAQVAAKEVVADFANVPVNGTKFVATAQLSDLAKNISNKVDDFAVINTALPGAPKVVIQEDENDNAFVSLAELKGLVNVKVTAPAGAVAGDILTVTATTNQAVGQPQNITLTQAQIDGGVDLTYTAPADGATLTVSATLKSAASGNVSNPGSDSAKFDLSDFSKVDPANPNGPRISAVGVNIDTDNNTATGDGIITAAELTTTGGKIKVTISLPAGAAVGDTLTVNASGNSQRLITLTQAQIDAKQIVITDYNSVGDSNTFEVTASIKDQAGNASPTPDAKDSAILRTVIAGAPVVVITEDTNNDGFINVAELNGTVGVNITIPTAAKAGDTLRVTINGTPQDIVLTQAQISAASITQELTAPANGQSLTVKAQLIAPGNQASAEGTDIAVVDTTLPNGGQALGLAIDADVNNDGWVNRLELGNKTSLSVSASFDKALVSVGDKVTISLADGSQAQVITLDSAAIAAGKVTGNFSVPAEGQSLSVKAVLKDSSGNTTPEATDSAKLDTSNFGPDTNPANASKNVSIVITSDTDNGGVGNGVLGVSELTGGKIFATVTLSSDAKAGDTLVVEGTGNTAQEFTLSAEQVAARQVLVVFNAPANGTNFVATAELSDLAKNTSGKVTDSATIDTSLAGAPTVVILEDADNNGFINKAELSGQIDVKVTVPAGAVVGDTIIVTDGVNAPQTFTLTATQIANGILTSFAAPADGSTFTVTSTLKAAASGNVSNPGSVSAKLDLTDFSKVDPANPNGPRISAVGLNIDTDNNTATGDGIITAAELTATGGKIKVTISLPAGAAVGDTLTVNASGNSQRLITLTQAQIDAKQIVITDYNSVGDSNTFEVSASIKDQAGNASPTPDAKDSAILRTVIAGAPVVVITEDTNNDGFINVAELSGTVGVNITIPTAAKAGDTLRVTINGTPQDIVLTQAQISAASITQELTAPANGQSLTVKAQLIAPGNQASAEGTDIAVVDTSTPVGAIRIDAITGDDFLTASETAGTVTITGTVTGEFKAGDVVTITVNGTGTPYSATVNAAGQYSVTGVPGAALGAGANVAASVLAHDGAMNSATYTNTRPYTKDTNTEALKTALTLDPVAGNNIIDTTEGTAVSTTLTGKATGAFAAGDVVTLTVNDVKFTGTVNAAGVYSIAVNTADLKADTDTRVEARIAATVPGSAAKQTAEAAQDYVVEDTNTAGKLTAISIDAVTADNIINSTEAAGNITVTGKVTGKFAAGDTVTLTVKGAALPGTVLADGTFSILVSGADLVADSNTQIEASVTGTGGTTANALQNYAVVLNVAPVNTVPAAQTVAEDTQQAITGISVSDADGNLATTQISVLNGNLNVTLSGGATITAGANNSATMTLSGTQAQINAALATIQYKGAANYNGNDTLTVLSTDGQSVTDSDTVAITVTAVDDNASIGGTTTGVATEDTLANASGTLTVTDGDAGQATLQAATTASLVGTYGNFTLNASTGAWTYTLDNTKAATQALKAGQQVSDKLNVKSSDATANQDITVTITGTNDAPVVNGNVNVNDVIFTDLLGAAVLVPGISSTVSDFLANTSYTFGSTTGTMTGNISAISQVIPSGFFGSLVEGDTALRLGQGPANFDETASVTFNKAVGQVVIKISALGQNVQLGYEEVKISINGQPFKLTQANLSNSVDCLDGSALTPTLSADGALIGPDHISTTITINLQDVPGGINSLAVFNDYIRDGSDFGPGGVYAKITATEIPTATPTASKTVNDLFGPTFTDVDTGDAFRGVTITSAGQGTDATNLGKYQYQKAGTSTWVDLPSGLTDTTSVYLAKEDAIRFVPSSTNSSAFAKPDLTARLVDNSATTVPTTGDVIDVAGVKHGGSTPYSGDTATLRVGPNTVASISGTSTGSATEDNGSQNSATGTLTVTDPDAGQATLQTPSNLAGTYGNFALNTATGVWTYTLDNTKAATQALKAGQQVFDTLTVASADGSATRPITVTITGTNDVAVISGPATGELTEDSATTVASGTLTVTDVDTGEAAFATPTTLAGTYGNFTFNTATGEWTYTLDNTKATTNALNTGDTVFDTVTVKSTDGTGSQEIKVTIRGANEIVLNTAPVPNPADGLVNNPLQGQDAVTVSITDNTTVNAGNFVTNGTTVAQGLVRYTLSFSGGIDAATLTEADIKVSNGTLKAGSLTRVGTTNEWTVDVQTPASGNGATSVSVMDGAYTGANGLAGQGNSATQAYGTFGLDASGGAALSGPSQGTSTNESMASLADGGWVTATFNTAWTIGTLTRYSASGQQINQKTFYINSAGNLPSLSVVSLSNGELAVVNGDGYVMTVNRFDANLAAIGTQSTILQNVNQGFTTPSSTALEDGGFVVAWVGPGTSGATPNGLFAQRYDASGEKAGAIFQIDAVGAGPGALNLASLNGGGFIATWVDNSATLGERVLFQKINADGTKNGAATVVVSSNANPYYRTPVVEVLADDSFIVGWSSATGGTAAHESRFQRFGANGVAIGGAIDLTAGVEVNPQIAALENGGFVMTWLTNFTFKYEGVAVQVFDALGNKVGNQATLATYSALNTHITGLTGGGYALSYNDSSVNGYNFGTVVNKVFAAPGGSFLSGATAGGTDTFTGGDGTDVITANGGADVIYAGAGNDTVIVNADNITQLATAANMVLDGGTGINTLKVDGTGSTLDLTNATIAAKVSNFSVIDLTGTGNNTLKLNAAVAKFLSGASDNALTAVNEAKLLVVNGNSGDAVQLLDPQVGGTSQWTAGPTETGAELIAKLGAAQGFVSGQSYKAYTLAGATVYINTALSVTDFGTPTTAPAPVATAGQTVQELFGTRFTDVDGASVANGQFKGVAITDAGTSTEQSNQGVYQWSTDGTNWTPLAAGLGDSNAVFLAPTTLIRFQAAAGVATLNLHDLSARLVDMSGQTNTAGLTNGATTNASSNGGTTAFSGTPITLKDLGAPAAPAIVSYFDDVGSATGNNASGTTTDDAKPAISGTAEAGSVVKLYNNNVEIVTANPIVANGAGVWTYTPTADQANGLYTITAKATDASNNVSGVSNTFTYTVTAPELNAAPVANPTVVSNVFAATAMAPEVTITDDQSTASVANGTQVTYTLKFSEAIKASTLTETDLTVTNGTLVAGSLTQVDATTWTVKASAPASGSGAVAISLADGSYTNAAGVNGLGNSATQGYGNIPLAATTVEIGGAASINSVPTGWTMVTGSPDINDSVNTAWIANYSLSNLNGTSSNGGTYVDLASFPASVTESMKAEMTGLTVGQTYSYGVQWQQISLLPLAPNPGITNLSGGQLSVTINGTTQTYTSSGVADGWQTALFTFVATSSSMDVTLAPNGTTGTVASSPAGAVIAVDSLSLAQITSALLPSTSFSGTTTADTFAGTDTDETFNIATAATSAAQGTDKVFAGAGNDTVIFNNNNAGVMTVDGGSGVNFLKLDSAATATSLDLTDAAVRARIKNFSSIDMTGAGNNTLKLDWTAVASMSGTTDVTATAANESKMLVVSGNADDTLNLVNLASWNVGAAQTAASLSAAYGSAYNFQAGKTYKAYTLNGATVFVDQAITVPTTPISSTTASVAYSQAVTIDTLFAATFTDSNAAGTANATFKGVAITTAGSASDVTNLGKYQLSKDGGATWTDVAGGLTDSTAVYADKTALIRFAGASGVEAINPPNLTVRLIDNSGATGTGTLTAASTGNTVNASVNGGATAFSGGNNGGTGDTVTINLLNRAPVSSDADGVVTTDLLGAAAIPTSVAIVGSRLDLSASNTTQSGAQTITTNPEAIQIKYSALSNYVVPLATESASITINGTPYKLSLANFSNLGTMSSTNLQGFDILKLSADGYSFTSTLAESTGTITILARDVPGGVINSVLVTNTVVAGLPNGADYTIYTGTALATPAQSVEALFGPTYTDADFDTMRGVVITSAGTGTDLSNLGQYQYSTNGGTTWLPLAGGLTDSTSVFLAKTDLIRFVPSASNTSLVNKQDLTARLVDDSAAVAPTSGATVDVSGALHGGSTPYSGNAVTLHVEPVVNSAPVLADTALSFANLAQSATPATPTGAVGVLVSSLLGGVTDANATDGKGMAITSVDTANGKLFYSTNGGTTWTAVDTSTALSDARAFLIGSDADNRLYFQPNANYAGTSSNALTFRAWDQTAGGTEASFTNITANGGSTAFSAATDTVGQTVPLAYVVLTDAINGEAVADLSGFSVSNAGDVNGDGYDDLIIGAIQADRNTSFNDVGKSYVVFGGSGNVMPLNLTSLSAGTSSAGFMIQGVNPLDTSGWSVSAAGDLNGDGLADLIIGAQATATTPGRSYVVYGKTDSAVVSLVDILTATSSAGFVINGTAGDQAGYSVSGAGDVNGDGLADFIVGRPRIESTAPTVSGQSYVVFGKTDNSPLNLTAIGGANSGGYVINGEAVGDQMGTYVSNAGDVNGDGLSDVIVNTGVNGKSYVVFGQTASTAINLSAVAGGTGGFAITGMSGGEIKTSNAGDVNGDGLADVIVSAPLLNGVAAFSGRSYVVFGKTGTTAVNVSSLSASSNTNGFVIDAPGTNEVLGSSVSYAGDINGDGLADLIVGSRGTDKGRVYVVYGKTDGTAVSGSAVAAGSGGFVINGQSAGDQLGKAVSYAGDINGDGYDDLLVTAPNANTNFGKTYIVYGGSQFISGSIATGSGTAGDEYVAGTNGNDTLTGGGGTDRFNAGRGNDTIVLQASDVTNLANTTVGGAKAMVDGGTGFDTLQVSAAGVNLDMTAISNVSAVANEGASRINSIERINLGSDATANTLTLTAKDVNDMVGFNSYNSGNGWVGLAASVQRHQLLVDGNSADTLTSTDAWSYAGTATNGGKTYSVYNSISSMSQIIVDSTVQNKLNPGLSLAIVDTGLGGYAINGEAVSDSSGYTIRNAGDVNGDGYDDILISTPFANVGALNDAGKAYVVYGKAGGLTGNTNIELSSVAAGVGGFVINGAAASDYTGTRFSAAGDVNGDGLADVIVSSENADVTTAGDNIGRAFVVYGKTSGAAVNLSAVATSEGFSINAGQTSAGLTTVGQAGDVNGDGLADLIVSTTNADSGSTLNIGKSYVVFGSTNNSASVNLTAIEGGVGGFVVNGPGADVRVGYGARSAGDFNGDGLSDLIMGADFNASNAFSGTSYIVYGKTSTTAVDLSNAGTAAFAIVGQSAADKAFRVSNAGDVNGDGLADVVVGAIGADTAAGVDAGRSYVVFGKTGASGTVQLSAIAAGVGGFAINGEVAADTAGIVSYAGDINGDGLADLIVAAPGNDNLAGANAGRAYVVYGQTGTTAVNLSTVANGVGGLAINGFSTGSSVSSVSYGGDLNGDGYDDLLVATANADPAGRTDAGKTFVVFGGNQLATLVDFVGDATANTQTGTTAAETFAAGDGNDTLIGNGGADVMSGGRGNDMFVINASNITALNSAMGAGGNTAQQARVNGGTGVDTLQLSGGASLDLTAVTNVDAMSAENTSRIESIERIDMATDTSANTLTLTAKDVNDMAGFNVIRTGTVSADGNIWANVTGTALSAITKYHQLVVDGTNVDTLSLSNNELWTKVGEVSNTGSVLASTHAVYQNNATNTQLIVDKRVNIQQLDFARVSISDNQTSATTGNNTQLTFTLKFSEAVDPSTLTTEDLNVVNGTLVPNSFTQVDSTTWTAQVTTPTSGSSATVLSLSDNSYKAMSTAIGLGGSGVQAYGALGTGASPGSGYSSGTNSYSAIGAFTNGSTVFAYSNGLTPWATQGGSLYPNGLYEFSYLTVELYRADGSSVLVENIDQASKWNGTRHTSPQVAQAGADGSFVVTWNFYGSNGYFYPYAQKYSADGVAVGPRTALATTGSFSTVVAPLGLDGSYSITWTESNVIKFQRFNADGTKTNYSLMTLDGDGNGADTSPQVISTGADGGSVVTWTGPDGSGQPTVFVQKVFANSGMSGLVKLKAPSASTNSDSQPDILVVGNSGEYVVTWTGKDEGGDTSIFVQKFNADGSTTGNAVVKLEGAGSTSSNDSAPQAYSIAADGSFALVWTVTGTGKYMQKFNANGTTNGTTAYVAPADAQVVVFDNGDYALSTLLNNNTIVTTKYSGAGVMLWTDSWFYPAPSNVSPWAVNGMSYTMVAQADGGIALGGVAAVTGTSYNSSDSLKFYVDYTSTGRAFVKTGTSGTDVLVGTDGADYITAAGGADIVYAGAGNDSVTIDASNISSLGVSNNMVLDGGSGINKLILNTSTAQTLDLTNILVSSKVNGFTLIDLTTGTNTLTLSQTQAAVLSGASDNASTAVDESKMLIVNGNAGDGVQFMDGTNWSAGQSFTGNSLNLTYGAAFAFKSSSTYKLYTAANGATVFVNSLVTVTGNIAPVVLDMNGDGELSYARMLMDVNSDGEMDMTLWAGRQDGVLVWDKYHDGKVHNHTQYAFVQYGGESDLEGLAAMFDTNRDGQLNAADALFGEFKVWQDANQNGVSDAGELLSLTDAGIASINLVSDGVQRTPVAGVTEAGQTTATMVDGQSVLVADAAFVYETAIDADMAGYLAAQQSTDVTPEQVAAAIAVCTSAAESSVYSLSNGQSLDLTTVLKDMSFNGIVKGLEQVDMATDTSANKVSLTLADVLSLPPTNGVHQLMLTGAANDKLMLTEGEWTDTGNVVKQNGQNYAVYSGTTDPSAQLLIDQHMLQSHQTS